MPCTLTGSIEGDRSQIAQLHVTSLVQLLCGACKLLEDAGVDMSSVASAGTPGWLDVVPPITLDKWWEGHKKVDAKNKK